jgi:D-alanyl-D-alanine carboxypeptidase
MNCPTRAHRAPAICLLLAIIAVWTTQTSLAAPSPLLGSIVIDASTGDVLHAHNANRRVRPASLNKLMTALLIMQHLQAQKSESAHDWPISAHAAAQPASRLGLRSGRQIAPNTVLNAVLVPSANDAAMVAAEAIAGDERSFVQQMNAMAAHLGMARTRFANASGLPAPQFTSARDIAVLAQHLWQTFPQQRKRFGQTGMHYRGRWVSTTNPLLGSYRGARGMKTGFTCRAGFHLVGVAEREGRTLIAVVLGAGARKKRVREMRALLNTAFAGRTTIPTVHITAFTTTPGQGDHLPVSTTIIANSCLIAKGPSGWNIDVGVQRSAKQARKLAQQFIKARRSTLRRARAMSIPRYIGVELHRAIVTGLDQDRARTACLDFRKQGGSCIIFGSQAVAAQLEEVARIRTLASAYRAREPKPGDN